MKRDFTFKSSPAFKSTSSLNPIKRYATYIQYYVSGYGHVAYTYTYYTSDWVSYSYTYLSGYHNEATGTVTTYGNNGYNVPGYYTVYNAKYTAPGGYTYYTRNYTHYPSYNVTYSYVISKYTTYRSVADYATGEGGYWQDNPHGGSVSYYYPIYGQYNVYYIVD